MLEKWVGRRILSQYGLICDVLRVEGDKLICLAEYKKKEWDWTPDTVSLITRQNEILDPATGEIYGKVFRREGTEDRWSYKTYPDDQCRTITQQEVENEFNARD